VADELKPAYLIAGSDRPKIDRALERLRGRFAPDAVELHGASELTGEGAVAACNALGLFATDGRLIVVEGVEEWKAPDAKEIAAYLKEPAPATTLALVGGELKKDAPLAKAVSGGKGELLLWDVPQRGLQKWVAELFGLHAIKAEPEACRALLELVGDDVYDLSSEIDKLATWAAGDAVTAGDVERLVAARAETTNFALTDAWGARDVSGVLQASEGMLERSGDPHSKTIPRVAAILTSHVARIRRAKVLDTQGIPAKEAAAALRQHPYYVGKLYAQARNYDADELRQATVRLAALDHALKGGSRLAPELELERALIEITRPRSP
jgi:DNA polymerase-3 subunit delta